MSAANVDPSLPGEDAKRRLYDPYDLCRQLAAALHFLHGGEALRQLLVQGLAE